MVVFFATKEQENVSTDRAEKRLQQTQNVRSVYWERFAPAVSRREYRIIMRCLFYIKPSMFAELNVNYNVNKNMWSSDPGIHK